MTSGERDAPSAPKTALVLSGGGARGAYEAGVLMYLFQDLPKRRGRPTHFDIITGTSVGGVHACFVASAQQDPDAGARVAEIWRSLSLGKVFAVGAKDLIRVPWRLAGFGSPGGVLPATGSVPERIPGLFDTGWLEEVVATRIDWEHLRANIDKGDLDALALAAAECLRHQSRSRGLRDWLSGNVARYAGRGALGEADLLSYLFFDRGYADQLIELGRRDAASREAELIEFLS
ncbi:MAG: patatin-like phospholipase family protein [Candidatus Binatia bacterium]